MSIFIMICWTVGFPTVGNVPFVTIARFVRAILDVAGEDCAKDAKRTKYPRCYAGLSNCHIQNKSVNSNKKEESDLSTYMGGCGDIQPYTGIISTRERKMDKQDDQVKGTDIVTILCMVVFTVCLAILIANLPFGIVG
jgi:hypothetical protein